MKRITNLLLNAFTGWCAGSLSVLILSMIWLKVFPVIDRTGQGPNLPYLLLIIILILSPISIIAGLIGGRLPREGGRRENLVYAALFGFLSILPFACFILYYIGF